MTQEFEAANERMVKVELHLHLSVAGDPRPDWRDWPGGPNAAPQLEPPRPRRLLAKSFTVVSLLIVGGIGASFVHRVLENSATSRAEFATPPLTQLPSMADIPREVVPAPAPNPRPEVNAGENSGEPSRRGTGAFGLR
ncbi:hypothetical protein GGD83_004064 [Rhodoblastus sphagnicola]|nr:hypothetical protein [Rhodoblastus sphagnicola]MBB4200236.1 hypothetical protein [Rhodoblastus sphagnicola]